MALTVWSERDNTGSFDDCTEAAYLMVLAYAGFDRWPLGYGTVAEREALDAAGEPDPPAGGSTFDIVDRGSLARYRVKLLRIPDGSRAGLRWQLNTPGRALALAGSYAGLPPGHRLRRWQPSYVKGHAVCVIPERPGQVRWLDPLAPAGHLGDMVGLADALAFAWTPSDARYALAGSLAAMEDDMPNLDEYTGAARAVARAGGTLYQDPDRGAAWPGSWPPVDMEVTVVWWPRRGLPALPGNKARLAGLIVGSEGKLSVGWYGVDRLRLLGGDSVDLAAVIPTLEDVTRRLRELAAGGG